MSNKPHFTNKERKRIVKQVQEGRSLGEVAREVGRNKMTIYNIVKRDKETGTSRTKRKKKLSGDDKRSIKALIKEDDSLSAHEIIENLGLNVSVPTLCKYLRVKGYKGGAANRPRRTRGRQECKGTWKLSEEDKADITALLEEDNTLSSREIRKKLGLGVSINTLCKYLIGAGYVCDAKNLPKRTIDASQ